RVASSTEPPMNPTRTSIAALLLALLWSATVAAHTVGISRGEYRPDASGLAVALAFARPELSGAVPGLDADRNGALVEAEVRDAEPALARFVEGGIDVHAGEARCPLALSEAHLTDQDGIVLRLHAECPRAAGAYRI